MTRVSPLRSGRRSPDMVSADLVASFVGSARSSLAPDLVPALVGTVDLVARKQAQRSKPDYPRAERINTIRVLTGGLA